MSLLINEDCPICSGKGILLTSIPSNVIGHNISCPRCGNFQIALTTYLADIPKSNNWSPRQRANASGWIREHPGVQLTIDDFKYLGTLPSPTVTERAYKLIIEMEKRSDNIDTYFDFSYDDIKMQEWVAISWSSNLNEIKYLLVNYLLAKGLVIGRILEESDGWTVMDVQLSPSGHELIEKILSKNTDSLIGFCAMWFDPSMDIIWDQGIKKAISNSGYQPFIIRNHEHMNRIDDEIIAKIQQSKFIVADFTGQRGGVYFESGYALGLGIRVIWTCREDELNENKIHFDNRQYNFLSWTYDKLDEFALRLQNRIEATIGKGSWTPDLKR